MIIRRNDVIKKPIRPIKPVAPQKILVETISRQIEPPDSLLDFLDFAKNTHPALVKVKYDSYYENSYLVLYYEKEQINKDYDKQYALYLKQCEKYEKEMQKYLDYKKSEIKELEKAMKI